MYQQYEALARERMREHREYAAHRRLLSELASVRMWQRVADYSARRAVRAQHRLDEHSTADYQLVA